MTTPSGKINTDAAEVPLDEKVAADIETDVADLDLEEKTFADFGVTEPIVEALAERGIVHPFPIQALTLPIALKRADIIGQAKTGTGKTLGFGIPMLQSVIAPGEEGFEDLAKPGAPQALAITPTRELAVQVAQDLREAGAKRPIRFVEAYGGRSYEPQVKGLEKGAEIVVGTPGRLLDLMRQKVLDLSQIRTLVLDEADEMLDLGFLEDVEKIISGAPASRHTMLFSATMPGPIVAMARRYMSRPTHIRAQDPTDDNQTVKATTQVVYRTHEMNKIEVLARIMQAEGRELSIVFTRTKRQAARIAQDLEDRGFATGSLHGDLGQGARERALRAFRQGKIDILVATDVAARGIDVDNVTHVINYQCPDDEKTYIHRIGRTGRAGHKGTAVTFVDWEDMPRWSLINNALHLDSPEPVETYHTSEHLYSDLGIPEDVDGRLPRHKRTREGLYAEKIEDIGETGVRSSGGSRGGGRGGRGRDGGRDGGRGRSSRGGDREGTREPRKRNRTRRRTKNGRPQRRDS